MTLDISKHPCFNEEVRHLWGRIHLPVAPRCNIQCNFCDRRYDCANETRPGVTSFLLTPRQALSYVKRSLLEDPRLAVVGIAGPGDPFANVSETMQTLRLVREHFPQTLLCVATNGLNVTPYVDELAELSVCHVTVTVNAVDPRIGEQVYAWVRDGGQTYRGREAAELLLARQQSAIRALSQAAMTVKVNSIVMPGINDCHIEEVARTVGQWGAELLNCVGLYPVAGTPLESVPGPSAETMAQVRSACEKHLPVMTHCTRCRADAVGLLGEPTPAGLPSDLVVLQGAECLAPGRRREP